MKKVCITSFRSVGCTFVDWSIHFLSGQTEFFRVNTHNWQPLCNNPIKNNNSHGHQKNHPSGHDKFAQCIDLFDSFPGDYLYSVYPIPLYADVCAKLLNIPDDQVGSRIKEIQNYCVNDYNQLLELCHQRDTKLIFVADDPRVSLYFLTMRSMDRHFFKPQPIRCKEDAFKEIEDIFFKNSIDRWKELGLVDIWDQRERLALNARPYAEQPCNFNLKHPHLWINCQDLWHRGEEVIQKIMHYLDLETVPTRFRQWKKIYRDWQKIQLDALEFSFNCQHIVDSIINNWYYEIDLTFDQEVIIQHLLIYKHNLNLKTWQLTKFPNNTQELHKLLEANTHLIEMC